MGFGEIQKVLRNLLRESVPVRNMPAILEGFYAEVTSALKAVETQDRQ